MPRTYRLGARQAGVERTSQVILAAARRLLAAAPPAEISVGAIAREAGVSRLTVYQRFGSRSGLLDAISPRRSPVDDPDPDADARDALRHHFLRTCEAWATAPSLHRNLPARRDGDDGMERRLAERLLAADALRPGCSIREAEDVITALSSFAVFDRLHRDGRRSAGAIADILMRLAGGILK
ncbi:MAG TPA: TetR family transcriptional regulator [Candidatus Dormibacteraeota bacterium]|nr:TetR family transcriptional regulator [Candidatus Dormibacteraeota bacterium]